MSFEKGQVYSREMDPWAEVSTMDLQEVLTVSTAEAARRMDETIRRDQDAIAHAENNIQDPAAAERDYALWLRTYQENIDRLEVMIDSARLKPWVNYYNRIVGKEEELLNLLKELKERKSKHEQGGIEVHRQKYLNEQKMNLALAIEHASQMVPNRAHGLLSEAANTALARESGKLEGGLSVDDQKRIMALYARDAQSFPKEMDVDGKYGSYQSALQAVREQNTTALHKHLWEMTRSFGHTLGGAFIGQVRGIDLQELFGVKYDQLSADVRHGIVADIMKKYPFLTVVEEGPMQWDITVDVDKFRNFSMTSDITGQEV